jgi:hypothetical protein
MSISIYDKYPGRATGKDPNTYPDGSIKNETVSGMNDGTPLEKAWGNDIEGLTQGLRARAGIVANGVVDDAFTNQNLNALDVLFAKSTRHPAATPGDICSGLVDADWANPNAALNYLDTGETIRDSCIGWDASIGKHFLFILYGTTSIAKITGCIDYSQAPVLGSPLSFSWGTTPDKIYAICCDGNYLYVAWDVTGGDVQVSRFAINPWTGTELATRDTGVEQNSGSEGCRLCVADSDNIGILVQGIPARPHIGVLPKTLASCSIQSFSAFYSEDKLAKLVSDGTYLYTLGHDGGSVPRVFSLLWAEISDVSTQYDDSIKSSNSSDYEEHPTGLVHGRDLIVATSNQGEVFIHRTGEATARTYNSSTLTVMENQTQYGVMIGSDHTHFHMAFLENSQPSGEDYWLIHKRRIAEMSSDCGSSPSPAFIGESVARTNSVTAFGAVDHVSGNVLFDGIDIWLVTYDGLVYRFVNPGGSI